MWLSLKLARISSTVNEAVFFMVFFSFFSSHNKRMRRVKRAVFLLHPTGEREKKGKENISPIHPNKWLNVTFLF